MVVRNDSGFTQKLDKGMVLGVVENAEVLEVPHDRGATNSTVVNRLDSSSDHEQREEKLLNKLKLPMLPPDELQRLKDFLVDHDVFSLEEGKRGETDNVQFEIDTGDAPQKQPPRRMPFAVRQEVASSLSKCRNLELFSLLVPPGLAQS